MENVHLPSLQTPRLLLRPLEETDIPALLLLGSDPAVSRYTMWNTFLSKADAIAYLYAVRERQREGTAIEWGITLSGALVGTVGLYNIHRASLQETRADLGYAVHRSWWGQGVATEAAREVVSFGERALGLTRIYAKAVDENPSSVRVLEKVGFQRLSPTPELLHLKGRALRLHTYAHVPGR